ncbi:hypothetical protein EDB83DRAFT_2531354 [Lactarius deliciosus]|nr:hypothetical protein EDB83DRAFT_2531354 [Lactarius deliciosus]
MKTTLSAAYSTPLRLQRLQYATLVQTVDVTHMVPLDFASYRVDLHQLEEAIETLESGRALLWSEMRRLRVSIDHDRPTIRTRDLEELTKSVPPSHKLRIGDGARDELRAVDPFGCLLLTQRGLLKERKKLISRIRALPGSDSFLTSPSFCTLRSAASSAYTRSSPPSPLNDEKLHYHNHLQTILAMLFYNALVSLVTAIALTSTVTASATPVRRTDNLQCDTQTHYLYCCKSGVVWLVGLDCVLNSDICGGGAGTAVCCDQQAAQDGRISISPECIIV